MGDATGPSDEDRLAPLVGLVERLRAEMTELPGGWEALGEELEAKRRRLGLAAATVELLRRQEEVASEEAMEGAAGGEARHVGDQECVSEAAQASVKYQMRPPYGERDWILGQAPAGSPVVGKRPHPPGPGDRGREGPCLKLVTSLPLSVWREHLRPLLPVKAVVQLRRVCKALKALLTDWPMRLQTIKAENLEAALRCFPATESLAMAAQEPPAPAEESRLTEWSRRHGGTLKQVMAVGDGARRLLSSLVRAGALPKLADISLSLENPIHQEILAGRMPGLLKKVHVTMKPGDEEQIAALEHLRHLPHLQIVRLECRSAQETALPLFIPPSLKSLFLTIGPPVQLYSLLRQLPSMLQASGASPRTSRCLVKESRWSSVVLRLPKSCASARRLKTLVLLSTHGPLLGTASIPSLLPGLLSCRATLEVLHCPWAVSSALPATFHAFPRLRTLCLQGGPNEDIDLASPAWELMANGGLPALDALSITGRKFRSSCHEAGGAGEGAGRLVRAFEAVAGTLNRLCLSGDYRDGLPPAACYELGAAIGKLRHLWGLGLAVFSNGQAYFAVGRGLADSGGCPELVGIHLQGLTRKSLDWLTYGSGFIVPSVRSLYIAGSCTGEEALLLCCGLLQMGYKTYAITNLRGRDGNDLPSSIVGCMNALLSAANGMNACM
jgi:hypothetical protein